jgi:hypothetical protein
LVSTLSIKGISLLDLAAKGGFTEYALYSTWAQHISDFPHADTGLVGANLATKNPMKIASFWIDPDSGIFAVMQSRTGIPVSRAKFYWNASCNS